MGRSQAEAELVATKLAYGENDVLRLTSADRANYVQVVDLLNSFNRPLNLAVAEYVEALKLLPTGTSLKEAVTDFRRRHLDEGGGEVSVLEKRAPVAEAQIGGEEGRLFLVPPVHQGEEEPHLNRFDLNGADFVNEQAVPESRREP